jgi:hypothetical protein
MDFTKLLSYRLKANRADECRSEGVFLTRSNTNEFKTWFLLKVTLSFKPDMPVIGQ